MPGSRGPSTTIAAWSAPAPPEDGDRPVIDPPWIDEDGILRRGRAWVALPDVEWRLLAPMVERAEHLIRREELTAAAWPGNSDPPAALNVHIRRIRRRIAPLGITITTVRGRGYVLGSSTN